MVFILLDSNTHSVFLMGETDKWVPVSEQRIVAITPVQDTDIVLTVAGVRGETVPISYLLDGTLQTVTCTFKITSSLMLSISNKSCWFNMRILINCRFFFWQSCLRQYNDYMKKHKRICACIANDLVIRETRSACIFNYFTLQNWLKTCFNINKLAQGRKNITI